MKNLKLFLVLLIFISCGKEEENIINEIQFTKGLQYFLRGFIQNQQEIKKFIDYCKSFENKEGYIMPSFFKNVIKNWFFGS